MLTFPTDDSADGIAFSVIEPASVIICACMPMVPGVYRRASGTTKRWLSTIYESITRSPGGSQGSTGSSRGHTREGPHGRAGNGREDSDSNAGSSIKMKNGRSFYRDSAGGILPPLPTHSKEQRHVCAGHSGACYPGLPRGQDRPFDGEYHLDPSICVDEKNVRLGTTTEGHGVVGCLSRKVGDDGYPQPDGQPKIGPIV